MFSAIQIHIEKKTKFLKMKYTLIYIKILMYTSESNKVETISECFN